MRQQSAAYNPFRAIRHVDMRVRFEFIDTDAKEGAMVTASGAEAFTTPENVLDEVSEAAGKWATLEQNLWALDGSVDMLPDNAATLNNGWWSNSISDDSAVFSDGVAEIAFSFAAPVSTIGFTLFFDDKAEQWPTKIRAIASGSTGATISDKTVETSGVQQIIEMPVQNYKSVRFVFLETLVPSRRVKMQEVIFGIVQIFDKDSLSNVKIQYGASTSADTFPSREMTFAFDNSDKKYNLLNPNGLYAYLQDGQEITASVILDGESVDMGKFYFTEAAATDGAATAQISANDIVLSLDEETYDGGASVTKTLSQAVSDVLSGKGISTNFSGEIGQTEVSMAIPNGTTKREAIRLLAQASMCSVWVDRDGVMQFSQLTVADTESGKITANELYNYNGVSVSAHVDAVIVKVEDQFNDEVEEQTYTSGSGTSVKTVSNPCVSASNGQAVADWLLACYQRRKTYKVKNRCDPAVEINDTVNIADAYGQSDNAVVTGVSVEYSGGLFATTSANGA